MSFLPIIGHRPIVPKKIQEEQLNSRKFPEGIQIPGDFQHFQKGFQIPVDFQYFYDF